MKKIITVLLGITLFYSCSKNDSPTAQNQNNNANSFSDVDGNIYQTVNICNQNWMKSNLNVSHYRNGDVIPQVTDATEWSTLTTGAWCYYNNDSWNSTNSYKKLYNWYAVNDPRGLAPVGYHIPSDNDWTILFTCLGGSNLAGGAMKSVYGWYSPNILATNSSGFSGYPGGARGDDGNFRNSNLFGSFYSSDLWHCCHLRFDTGQTVVGSNVDSNLNLVGLSVRCLKD